MEKEEYKKKEEYRKKDKEEFNSITQKVKVENQNQTHNSKKEGLPPAKQNR